MSVNKAILVGNLGKDPEVRYTSDQNAVCTFSLATNERRKDQSGNWSDQTEWHRVVTFGKTADFCGKYLKKGKQVYVEGKIRTNKWQDKNGQDRYTTEILANVVQFVGNREAGTGGGSYKNESATQSDSAGVDAFMASAAQSGSADSGSGDSGGFEDDDIPF